VALIYRSLASTSVFNSRGHWEHLECWAFGSPVCLTSLGAPVHCGIAGGCACLPGWTQFPSVLPTWRGQLVLAYGVAPEGLVSGEHSPQVISSCTQDLGAVIPSFQVQRLKPRQGILFQRLITGKWQSRVTEIQVFLALNPMIFL
jgi:hypothetical protein